MLIRPFDTELNDAQWNLLDNMYEETARQFGGGNDFMAYTETFELLVANFIAATGKVISVKQGWDMVMRRRKDGDLPKPFARAKKHLNGEPVPALASDN